jgi:hypothetical protein
VRKLLRNHATTLFHYALIDEKWFYTTSRRSEMKILPCADHESTEDAFVAVPKKSRYMAMPLANDVHQKIKGLTIELKGFEKGLRFLKFILLLSHVSDSIFFLLSKQVYSEKGLQFSNFLLSKQVYSEKDLHRFLPNFTIFQLRFFGGLVQRLRCSMHVKLQLNTHKALIVHKAHLLIPPLRITAGVLKASKR